MSLFPVVGRGCNHFSTLFLALHDHKPKVRFRDMSTSGPSGHFRSLIITGIAQGYSLRACCGRKPLICRWNFDICHTFGDVSTSGFGSHIAICGCRSFSKLLCLRSPWLILPGSQMKTKHLTFFYVNACVLFYRQATGCCSANSHM